MLEHILSDKKVSDEEKFRKVMENSRDTKLLVWLVSRLQKKKNGWDFDFLLDYLLKTAKSVICHHSPSNYGLFLLQCRDGEEYIKLKVEYKSGMINDMLDITPKRRLS